MYTFKYYTYTFPYKWFCSLFAYIRTHRLLTDSPHWVNDLPVVYSTHKVAAGEVPDHTSLKQH